MPRNFRALFLSALLLLSLALPSCRPSSEVASNTAPAPTATPAATPTAAAAPVAEAGELKTAPSGLQYQDLEVGGGQRPLLMQSVRVAYVGKFADGHTFDKGLIDFKLGKGEVLKGWEQGILGGGGVEAMRVGSKRKLIIPPALGYGDKPYGTIPANSTLIFEVELLRINSGGFGM